MITDGDWRINTGKVVVATNACASSTPTAAPTRAATALGVFTSRPAAGAFSRPRTNAPAFRQNDAVAREVLAELGRGSPLRAAAR